nr:sushi, nidogen and EGF-like domain-containing protein 1 [Misgurnus anguillicaudatus]
MEDGMNPSVGELKFKSYRIDLLDDDVDECQVNPFVCANSNCTNLYGGYSCSCLDGFTATLPNLTINTCADPGSFYPYGIEDIVNERIDDGSSAVIYLLQPYIYFGHTYNQIYVNNNGHLTFDTAWYSYIPYGFQAYGGKDIIAPLWTDIDNRLNGVISYQQYASGSVLTQATQDINQYFPDLNFSASWVFVATWDRVAYFPNSGTETSFQVVLISNGNFSFVLINYGTIAPSHLPVQAGYDNFNSRYSITGKLDNFTSLKYSSNVNVLGRWVFRTDLRSPGCQFNDVNEIYVNSSVCGPNSYCTNVNEGYSCSCLDGFTATFPNLTINLNNTCTDIAECLSSSLVCGPNSYCQNINGSYSCSCLRGYNVTNMNETVSNSNPCTDVDECLLNSSVCGPNSNCTNINGGYSCSCLDGFTATFPNLTISINNTCTVSDINECLNSSSICGPNSYCQNYNGSYSCSCLRGYNVTNMNETVSNSNPCTDVDECKVNSSVCGPNSNCTNVNGSYSCSCLAGFTATFPYLTISINNTCTDINECLDLFSVCGPNSYCQNYNGNYSCSCLRGYNVTNMSETVSNSNPCIDVDECQVNPFVCANSNCTNLNGGYSCSCLDGFTATLPNVTINTCADPGSFYPYGIEDIVNERIDDGSSAVIYLLQPYIYFGHTYNQIYVNNNGHLTFDTAWYSYIPYSIQAYGGIDIIAPLWTDIDNRLNGVISYQQYTSGSVLTQATQDINQYFPDLNFSASWVFVATWDRVAYFPNSGTETSFQVVLISNGNFSFVLINYGTIAPSHLPVQAGYDNFNSRYSITGKLDNFTSLKYSSNVNVLGRWVFRTDLRSPGCQFNDVNEIYVNSSVCGPNSYCTNVNEGYNCSCLDGFTATFPNLTINLNNTCTDIAECLSSSLVCGPNSYCQNINGSYSCSCLRGYNVTNMNETVSNSNPCTDVDECQVNSSVCGPNSNCTNVNGGYSCSCLDGFTATFPNLTISINNTCTG